MDADLLQAERQSLVSSFLEIAIGQSSETATQFLQATNWQLDEAVQLFYIGNEGGGVAPSESVGGSAGPREDIGGVENAVEGVVEDEVRPPLPVKREVLYDDATFFRHNPSSVVAFRNFEEESKRSGVWETDQGNASTTSSNSNDKLASLYRPPFALMLQGTFAKAKLEAASQDKWLLINLQSTEEFSSHMLNRDTWANEAVAQTIQSNFIFWQAYHDTSEGKKVCTYYKLITIPAILVIDPITGQKMRAWTGMVQPEALLEDLLPFMDGGPKDHHVALPNKRPRESTSTSASAISEEEEELRKAIAASLGASKSNVVEDDQPTVVEEPNNSIQIPTYPRLPEEPKSNKELVCRVGIRLPDGKRLQRNFFKKDPLQLLWSFCSSQLEEAKTRPLCFTQAIPGASKMIEYDSKLTIEESGLANSMISLTWV